MPRKVKDFSSGKRLLIFMLMAGLVTVLLAVSYWTQSTDESVAPESDPDAVFVPGPTTLSSGIYMLGALTPSVAYVVETTEGLILVDSGLEDGHTLLLRQLTHLGLDIQNLKLILITHGHGDHYLGASELRRMTGARIYAGQGDSTVLRDAGPREAVFSTFPMDDVPIAPLAVDVELAGGETITLGEATIRVVATPGHTPGSVCYLLEHQGTRALFSGDTIMTMTGDLGTYSTYLPPRYRGNAGDYLATLKKLQELPVPQLLLPGHPETQLGSISARITPEQWSSLLRRGVRQMETLNARYTADGADFLDGTPRELLPGLYYLGDYSHNAVYCAAKDSSIILFDAAESPEFVRFLESRLEDFGLDLSRLSAVVLTEYHAKSAHVIETLVQQTKCRIVAGKSDRDAILRDNPDANVLPPELVARELNWNSLESIAIEGLQSPRTAYSIRWRGKNLLISGSIPLKVTRESAGEFQAADFDGRKLMQSLARIREMTPDLWLPRNPVHGHNANLYGNEWRDTFRELQMSLGIGF